MQNEKNAAIPCIVELLHKSYARGRVMHICIEEILDKSGATFWRGCPLQLFANPAATAP
jgi:hypothetical protein